MIVIVTELTYPYMIGVAHRGHSVSEFQIMSDLWLIAMTRRLVNRYRV